MAENIRKWLLLPLLALCGITALAQQKVSKIIADCTIRYSVTLPGDDKKDPAVKTLYIKGHKTRSEIQTETLTQTTIYDTKTGDAVVLKEIGDDKYISRFDANQWQEKNSRWQSAKVSITNDTKTILGYECRKAVVITKGNDSLFVYYTTNLNASASENPYQFKDIPGLILAYSSKTSDGRDIEFAATDVNFNPVPAAKFAIPTTGYRLIEKEDKKM